MNPQESGSSPRKAIRRSKPENIGKTPLNASQSIRRGPRHSEPQECRFSSPSINSRSLSMRDDVNSTAKKKSDAAKAKGHLKSESFHTLPREPFAMVSRKDIIRRTCSKSENQNDPLTRLGQSLRKKWNRSSLAQKRTNRDDHKYSDPQRPMTLPSICRRSSGKDRDTVTMTLMPLTRISRQEIIRRNSSTNLEEQASQRRKSCGSLCGTLNSRSTRDQEHVSRHAGCFIKRTSTSATQRNPTSGKWNIKEINKTSAMQVPRPSTLPKITASRALRKEQQLQQQQQQHVYDNVSVKNSNKEAVIRQEAPIYGKIRKYRKISVPSIISNSPNYQDSNSIGEATLSRSRKTYRSIRDPTNDPMNYGMLNTRRQYSGSSMPNLPQRTMSRRRIIDNAEEVHVIKSLGRPTKARNNNEKYGTTRTNTLPSTMHNRERARCRNSNWYEPPGESARRLVVETRRNGLNEDSVLEKGSSKSLPSYMRKTRKASYIPLRVDRLANEGKPVNTINPVRKVSAVDHSATAPYSIFGLCTGRRKAQNLASRVEKDGRMNPYKARHPRTVRSRNLQIKFPFYPHSTFLT